MRDSSELDDALAERDADGYLFDDDDDSDQYYVSGFDAPDPFVSCYTPEELGLLVSGLEYGRATKESRADVVARNSDYDYRDLTAEHGPDEARVRVVAAFLEDLGVERVLVPQRFPVATADGLRDQGFDVEVDDDGVVGDVRARKTDEEVDHVRAAQRANEAAMARAEELLRGATIEDGVLHHDGEPLTSEFVKQEIEIGLLREGCALDDTIVAGGADGADPHNRGSGPLPAHEPIVIDIFPRSKATKYHADMTRTFVVGEADEEVRRRFDLTLDAQEAALDAIEAGVTGEAVHDAVCDIYAQAGYETLRSDPAAETGFIHTTGHGLGLDVHEAPRIGPDGSELQAGHVVTVEPGLYDPEVGGMRIEDFVVVTEDGYENLVQYPKELVVE